MWLSFAELEDLKSQYTGKRVEVNAQRPELARFQGQSGTIKTINMNGRALVEFADYLNNPGWYDIRLSDLTILETQGESSFSNSPSGEVPSNQISEIQREDSN